MSENAGGQIDNVMQESRLFPPSEEFVSGAQIGSMAAYEELSDLEFPVSFSAASWFSRREPGRMNVSVFKGMENSRFSAER